MSSSKHLLVAILAGVSVAAAGWLVDIWPKYRQAAEARQEAATYRKKKKERGVAPEKREKVEQDLAEVDDTIARMRPIPPAADLVELQRRFYIEEDGDNVVHMNFDAGDPKPAVPAYDVKFMAAPLTITMTARFQRIFDLIQGAETNRQHFLRIKSVRMTARRGDLGAMAEATVELQVIYEPPEPERGGA